MVASLNKRYAFVIAPGTNKPGREVAFSDDFGNHLYVIGLTLPSGFRREEDWFCKFLRFRALIIKFYGQLV